MWNAREYAAAVSGSQECVAEMRADYIKLRDQILKGFETIPGLTCTVPQGAFYVYPNVKNFIGKGGVKSASDLAAKLLSEAHVVVVPGEAFGTNEHIRLSYAVSHDVVDEGVKRESFTITSMPARFREAGDLWQGFRASKGVDLERATRYGKKR